MGNKVSRRRRNNTGQTEGVTNEAVSPTEPTPSLPPVQKVVKIECNQLFQIQFNIL